MRRNYFSFYVLSRTVKAESIRYTFFNAFCN